MPPESPVEKQFNKVTPYHYIVFAILFLSKIPVFWQVVSLLFLSPPMNYKCLDPPSEENNVCPCNKPDWDTSIFTKTLQTKYELICQKKFLVGLCHSMLYVGSLLGSFTFGVVSDRYGRLTAFCISILMMSVFGCVITLASSVYVYMFLRVMQGLGIGGALVTGFVYCIEYCGVNQRELVTAAFHIPLNISHMCLAGVSYIFRDMDAYQLAISIPLFCFIPMKWLVYESPKWLMDSGRIDEAVAALEGIAKFNKTSCGTIRREIEAYTTTHAVKQSNKAQFWDIFRYRLLVINFCCMALNYFACGMGFYGVSQYIGQMSGNIHLNVAISGATLIPGTVLTIFLLQALSRKLFLICTSFTSGILMLVVVIMPHDLIMFRVVVACFCNCAFFMSFIIIFLYGVELFPTSVRNSVLGILAVSSRVGQIVAPFINMLPPEVSGSFFGGFAILGGILCFFLPETKGKELPATLEDMNK